MRGTPPIATAGGPADFRLGNRPDNEGRLSDPMRDAGHRGCQVRLQERPMAKNETHKTNADAVDDDVPDGADIGALADTLVDRGRAVLDQFPAVADSARDVLAGAQDQVNGLSDMGIVAASGFALGVSSGLLLAGAPRAILILSLIPVAITLRSAFARGMRPARLLN